MALIRGKAIILDFDRQEERQEPMGTLIRRWCFFEGSRLFEDLR